jgi:hypothetical protein
LSTLSHHLKRARVESNVPPQRLIAVELRSAEPAEPCLEQARALIGEHEGRGGLAVALRCGRRIEVRRGFDAGVLEQLIRVLERM